MTYTLDWILSRSLSTPPGSPAQGDTYLVKATGTGAWAGKDGQIAQWQSSAWTFFAPYTGRPAYVADESLQIVYDGSAWATDAVTDSQYGLTVSSPSDTQPLIALNNTGNPGVTTVLIDHDPTALDSAAAHFYLNCATYVGINLPVSSRNDTIWTFGYNVSPAGGRLDSSEPELALHFENCYNQGGTDIHATSEWFLQFTGSDNVARRPTGGQFYRDGTFGTFSLLGSVINMYDWNAGQRIKFDFSNAYSNLIFPTQAFLSFDTNNTATLRQKNAAGTSYVTLLYLDATNTITTTTNTQVQGTLTSTGKIFGSIFSPTSATTPSLGLYAPAGELGHAVDGSDVFFMHSGGRYSTVGAKCDLSLVKTTPTTGFTTTIANSCGRLILDPAGTLATGTIVMPATPKNGQICTIASSQTVTALTHSPNTGQTLKGALTTITANGFAEYTYVASNTTWYRTG